MESNSRPNGKQRWRTNTEFQQRAPNTPTGRAGHKKQGGADKELRWKHSGDSLISKTSGMKMQHSAAKSTTENLKELIETLRVTYQKEKTNNGKQTKDSWQQIASQ